MATTSQPRDLLSIARLKRGQAAGPSFDQEPGSDRPDLVWPQRSTRDKCRTKSIGERRKAAANLRDRVDSLLKKSAERQ